MKYGFIMRTHASLCVRIFAVASKFHFLHDFSPFGCSFFTSSTQTCLENLKSLDKYIKEPNGIKVNKI